MHNALIRELEFVRDFSEEICSDIMSRYRFGKVGNGKDRHVYLSLNRRFVLKFPRSRQGIIANRNEHRIFRESMRRNEEIKFAPCRLIGDTNILMMLSVTETFGNSFGDYESKFLRKNFCSDDCCDGYCNACPLHEESCLPDWTNRIPFLQVGKLRGNGRIVAYDYGGEEPFELSSSLDKKESFSNVAF